MAERLAYRVASLHAGLVSLSRPGWQETVLRVTLPRLLDVVTDSVRALRSEGAVTFAAVDIKDAFHNVPAGNDRKYTVAAAEMERGKQAFIIYDVLVFGSRSSPTIWGRFAALLGRILAATVPENRTHIYVDDPIICVPRERDQAAHLLTMSLLCIRLFGYPLKLSKAAAGPSVKWIGAQLTVDTDEDGPFVKVLIPQDKVTKLLGEVERILKAPVVGTRQLRSFAGGMSFVAGLVPVLRPFLAPLWAALAKVTTDDGDPKTVKRSRVAGKLVHVKRVAHCLHWIKALLLNDYGQGICRGPGFQHGMGGAGSVGGAEIVADKIPSQSGGEGKVRQCRRLEDAPQPDLTIRRDGNHCQRDSAGYRRQKLSAPRAGACAGGHQRSGGRVEPFMGSATARISFCGGRGKRPTPGPRRPILESRVRKSSAAEVITARLS